MGDMELCPLFTFFLIEKQQEGMSKRRNYLQKKFQNNYLDSPKLTLYPLMIDVG